jgi:hypothetical protein
MSLIYTNLPYQFQDEIKETEVKTGLTKQARIRRGERFLKGPILRQRPRLPSRSLALFLAVHHQDAPTGNPTVTVPARPLGDLGISRRLL